MNPDPNDTNINAANVALRDLYVVQNGETIRLPRHEELLAYVRKVRDAHARWGVDPQDPSTAQPAAESPQVDRHPYIDLCCPPAAHARGPG